MSREAQGRTWEPWRPWMALELSVGPHSFFCDHIGSLVHSSAFLDLPGPPLLKPASAAAQSGPQHHCSKGTCAICLLLQLCNSDLRSCSIERHCTQAPRWVQCQHGIHQVAKLKWDVLADISAVVATAKTAIVWIAQRLTPTILDGRTQSNEHLLEQLALEGGPPRQITCQQRVHHTGN